jgi:hypothetical protein
VGRVGGGCVVVSVRCGQAVCRCRCAAACRLHLDQAFVFHCVKCVFVETDRSVPRETSIACTAGPGGGSRCAMQHRISDYRVWTLTGIPQDVPTSQPGSIPHPVRAGNFAIAATARRARRRVSPSVASVGRRGQEPSRERTRSPACSPARKYAKRTGAGAGTA